MRVLQRQHFGFTLIELLITVAIAAIVVGGSIAGFVRFNERQEVQNTAKEVQQLMRTAQSKARVRDAPDEVNSLPCLKLISYHVGFPVGQGMFSLRPHCDIATGPNALGSLVGSVLIPQDFTITSPIATDFTTLENGVEFSDGASAHDYRFEKNGYIYGFTVTSSGNISNVEQY